MATVAATVAFSSTAPAADAPAPDPIRDMQAAAEASGTPRAALGGTLDDVRRAMHLRGD